MAHDLNHSNGQLPARRTLIAHPSATPTLSEVEFLRRAARHIRLRTREDIDMASGDGSLPRRRVVTASRDARS